MTPERCEVKVEYRTIAWRCENDHVLGQVLRERNGASMLLLYRHAVDPGDGSDAVEVMAVVEGRVLDVRCDICGAVRTWFLDARTARKRSGAAE